MTYLRYIFVLCAFSLVGCDEMLPDEKLDEEKKELVTPEEKKALEKFGERLAES